MSLVMYHSYLEWHITGAPNPSSCPARRIRRLTPRTPRSAQLNSVPTVSLPRFLVSRSPLLPGSSYTARASKSLFSSPPPHPSVGECAPPAFANSRPGQHRRERRDDRSDKRRADRARRRDCVVVEAAFPESRVDVPARRKRCSARGARREERETSERARTKVSQSNPRYRTRPCTHTSTYRSRTAGSPPPWQPGCR